MGVELLFAVRFYALCSRSYTGDMPPPSVDRVSTRFAALVEMLS